MDRLPHPFSGARPSTHRTTRFYRCSRPGTIRPARRLPRRVLRRHKAHHQPSPLRRYLRASGTGTWSACRPLPACDPSLSGRSHPGHRLRGLPSGRDGACPVFPLDAASPIGRFPNSIPLQLSGYKILRFPLDRPHIREYVKHPRALFADLLRRGNDHKTLGRDSKLRRLAGVSPLPKSSAKRRILRLPLHGNHPSIVDGETDGS